MQGASAAELWAERIVDEAVRAMDPLERMERMRRFNLSVKEMTLGRLRERYPSADEEELKLRLCALRYGREFTLQFFGWDPDLKGW